MVLISIYNDNHLAEIGTKKLSHFLGSKFLLVKLTGVCSRLSFLLVSHALPFSLVVSQIFGARLPSWTFRFQEILKSIDGRVFALFHMCRSVTQWTSDCL